MNFLSKLFSSGIGGFFKTVMDEIRLAPEKKAEMEMQLSQLQAAAEQADRELEGKLNDIAGQNIRAESSSSDAFVRRSRPAFLWVMTSGIALAILIFPLINLCTGAGLVYPQIPETYLDLFKIAFLGYVTARTVEKVKDKA